jgi:hypothetical protein
MSEGVYMPLSGEELLELIFRKGKGVAAKYNQRFGAHVAYHNPRVQLAIKVDCHTPEGAPDTGGFELVVPLGGIMFEPDRAREEVGLGVYETKLVDEHSGTLADVKVGVKPDPTATIAKVEKLLAKKEEGKKGKSKSAKRKGWPKGKPRKSVSAEVVA